MASRREDEVREGDAADEEAPLQSQSASFPPREISFNVPQLSTRTFGDDDNTVPSELSTLIAPSTLTPNYDPNMVDNSHPSGSSSESKGRKAFQLALLLGLVSIGALFGADAVYMMVTSDAHDVSHNMSSSMSMGALENPTSVHGQRNEEGEPSATAAQVQGKKKAKKAKAKKNKAGKERKEESLEGSAVDDYDDDQVEEEEEEEEEEDSFDETDDSIDETDDELIATTTRRTDPDRGFKTADMIDTSVTDTQVTLVSIPDPYERCPHVIETFELQNADVTNMDFLKEKYHVQSSDPNVFYRATALLFWRDFGEGSWGGEQGKSVDFEDLVLLDEARYEDGTPLSPMSTWTWVTGDQHLSNFGAWKNRGGEVVFSVNDFDEAAIYDFHIDVLRIAVSICSHGFTNGLDEEEVREALEAFTYTYAKTAIDYVGGDAALVYELNPDTSTGSLRDFLWDVKGNRSRHRQMEKFTKIDDDGIRRFVRNENSRLEDVPPEIEEKIRAEITATRYGATMMKMGWKVRGWDDDFFEVLDVARRVGSGVGSYGVDRFYVLLKGEDPLLEEDADGASVILDVKYEPVSAVSRILVDYPMAEAWYDTMFRNEADRTAQAQRRLTSYTDPYVGYLVIDGNSYNVRQRSPYKSSFDYGTLESARSFNEFMEQIAIATATAHVRGSVAKSPGQFKHVIKLLLAGDRNRRRWSDLVAKIALSYRSQVLLDFECFRDYVDENFN